MSVTNLLKDRYPHLIQLWDYDKNVGIDINTITCKSNRRVWWKCEKGHSWDQRVGHRTTAKNVCITCLRTIPSNVNCSEASYTEGQTTVSMVDSGQTRNQTTNNSTIIGDDTEKYIESLIVRSDSTILVQRCGYFNGTTDLVLTVPNLYRKGIQVKTLVKDRRCKDSYQIVVNVDHYPKNMLIVMTNSQRDRFAIEFAGNITNRCRRFNFIHPVAGMYLEPQDLVWAIKQLLPLSADYNESDDIKSSNIRSEVNMLQRLEKFCDNEGLQFRRHITSSDSIDCFINDRPIQTKFCSSNKSDGYTYMVDTVRGSIKKSYHVNDPFHFIIVELGGSPNQQQKYLGQFCIIPKGELHNQKILACGDYIGKQAMSICPPDYRNHHWSKGYWGKVSLLRQ